MNVLFIDNFDSFTYNLVDEFEKRECNVLVYRNNVNMKMFDKEIKSFKPRLIVISPGPGNPKSAGNCIEIIKKYGEKIPIFGVCLGHQCLIEAFKGVVSKAPEIIHGKSSKIKHDGKGIFKGLENPFQAGRYHSLVGVSIPYCFEVSARTIKMNIVMAIRHKELNLIGVQFHPESILTPVGGKIIDNLLKIGGKND
jgi:anthranilate synthase/aminodeoxychorismate synthase-like glutamine amidotransferase